MKKILLIAGLVLFLIAMTGASYAYWDNLSDTKTETINIGESTSVTVSAVAAAPTGKTLIPAGAIKGVNDVDSVVLTYNVKLTKEAAAAHTLSVAASNIKINNEITYSSIVNVAISPSTTAINNTDVLITVTITLTEPGDVTAYNAVINKAITFDLTFSVA